MNSCLYECEVMHERLSPRHHHFNYKIFMFYFDLDEITLLHKKFRLFSKERFNWFSFRSKDHLKWPVLLEKNRRTKESILNYLSEHNVVGVTRVMLLTHAATFGYSFNPISFYFCFDENDKPICSVAEVCNTHREMKLYFLNSETLTDGVFRKMVSKYFYVSPFADLTSTFDFIFKIPDDTMHMRVDDYQNGIRFLLSSLTGKKKAFTDLNLLRYGLQFPLIPLKIITMIHWQALLLYLKRVPFNKKNFNMHLQKETYQYK